MKVCFFGSYEKGVVATKLRHLLQSKGVEVIECQEDVYSKKQLVKAYPKLFLKHIKKQYDVMIVPWRGIMTLPLAKLIKKGPLIYFPFVSIYDTTVIDRKKFKKNSIKAKILRFADKTGIKLAEIVVFESYETSEYFYKEYQLNKKKIRRLIWGTDENSFEPLPIKKRQKIFNVFYLGTFIPFHGVEIIVEAARILSKHNDIEFTLCGDGQTRKENKILSQKYNLKNIHFLGFVEFSILKKCLKNADVGIGVLGSADKRSSVLTNKIFQVLASQKPLITRDVPVMKEICLKNQKNSILIPPADPHELAKAILLLKNSPELSNKIAIEGYKTYKKVTKESWEDFWLNTLKPLLN